MKEAGGWAGWVWHTGIPCGFLGGGEGRTLGMQSIGREGSEREDFSGCAM